MKSFESTGAYIHPTTSVFGQGYKEKEEDGQMVMYPVLKAFLEMPGVLEHSWLYERPSKERNPNH